MFRNGESISIALQSGYSGKLCGYPPMSDGGFSGWRSIGRLLFSRANDG